MSTKDTKQPKPRTQPQVKKAKNTGALKAALRENLHKRKAQARAKKTGDADT